MHKKDIFYGVFLSDAIRVQNWFLAIPDQKDILMPLKMGGEHDMYIQPMTLYIFGNNGY